MSYLPFIELVPVKGKRVCKKTEKLLEGNEICDIPPGATKLLLAEEFDDETQIFHFKLVFIEEFDETDEEFAVREQAYKERRKKAFKEFKQKLK